MPAEEGFCNRVASRVLMARPSQTDSVSTPKATRPAARATYQATGTWATSVMLATRTGAARSSGRLPIATGVGGGGNVQGGELRAGPSSMRRGRRRG